MWRSSLLAYLVSGSIPTVHTASRLCGHASEARTKAVDQVPGWDSDLGRHAACGVAGLRTRTGARIMADAKDVYRAHPTEGEIADVLAQRLVATAATLNED